MGTQIYDFVPGDKNPCYATRYIEFNYTGLNSIKELRDSLRISQFNRFKIQKSFIKIF